MFIFITNFFNVVCADSIGYTSAIAINANNGEVLYSYRPDIKIYPASLTKMMTAYLTFQAIDEGIIGLNDNLDDKQTIKDLLLKMAVNSDNYSAIKLANEVSGDYNDFVIEMNKMAKKIRMNNTHFSNATGLFDENNYSTARDIAKLSIRLVYDFPSYIDIFETTNYIDENSEYNTKTSTIHQNVKGLKGGKTGYISASGYNLVVWGDYDGQKIFIVMIGADNRYSRDESVLKILNKVIKNNKFANKTNISKDNKDVFTNKIFHFIGLNYNLYLTKQPVERSKNVNINTFVNKNDKKTVYFYKKN